MTTEDEREQQLEQALGTATRQFGATTGTDTEDTLTGFLRAAVATVPGATHAGVSLLDPRTLLSTRAGTDALIGHCNQWHRDCDEGPCLEAIQSRRTTFVRDITRETRWPHFTARAAEYGLHSLLTLPLCGELTNLGTLTLYATYGHSLPEDAPVLGELFAAHTAVALFGTTPARARRPTWAARDVLNQATGILMHREDLTGTDAFTLLISTARGTGRPVDEVAAWLIDAYDDPGQTTLPPHLH